MILMHENDLETDRAKLIELIREHQRIKKNFEIQDAYKLIYQSVFGIGHILDNPQKARDYLKQEFDSVRAVDDESMIENISISGEIVRLNLRPYKYRNGSIDLLFQAMVRSSEEISGSREDFLMLWDQFKQAVLNGELMFPTKELKIFAQQAQSANYPARHHSAAYKQANHPAYRVIKRDLAERL
jgi:hypothetical protein